MLSLPTFGGWGGVGEGCSAVVAAAVGAPPHPPKNWDSEDGFPKGEPAQAPKKLEFSELGF